MVQQANGAIQTVATDFAGDSDPAAIAPPFSKWANTTTGVLFRRNAAGTAWVEIGRVLERPLYISDGASGVLPTGGFRNKLINGLLSINQRAVSGTVTLAAGAYGHDMFKAGSGGCTYTFSTANGVTTLNITAGTLVQVVEGSSILGGSHVLSWQGTTQGRINAGSFSSAPVVATLGGGANASVEFGTGTLSLPQLEAGSTPNIFEVRPMYAELKAARWYYRLDTFKANEWQIVATPSGGGVLMMYPMGEAMRIAAPTVSIDAAAWQAFIGGSWVTMNVNAAVVVGNQVQISWVTPGGAPASGVMLARTAIGCRVILDAGL
ncbi:hypothetical protein HGQ98_00770 [Achromobacter ruhlandii]|uniref:DUF2793 domain-containing protein n=1 Tax=Achromobacter ruhlandii TaxID=72557 RepID=A0A848NC14_9BURK|nr:hypothetical protein [Achromobacter ruhlandii]NMU88420.1 hypothetical protein [Achromobacter ruhlandii]